MHGVRAGDGVFFDARPAAAERADAPRGLLHLFLRLRAFHRGEHTADAHKRQTQLAEHRQARHGAGCDDVKALAKRALLLGAPGKARDVFKPDGIAHLLLERYAFLQTVDERDVCVRREDRRDEPRKPGAGADVRGGLAGETHIPEQRGAVEKVQPRRRLLALDGGEIHHL